MREFGLPGRMLVSFLTIALVLFQLFIGIEGEPTGARPIHVGVLLILYFLLYPPVKGREGKRKLYLLVDIGLAVLAAALSLRLYIFHLEPIVGQQTSLSILDWIFTVASVFLVLEVARRAFGWVLVIVALVFLVYGFVGAYMPGPLLHEGVSPHVFFAENYFSDVGLYGIITGLSVSYIFLLVVFASLLLYFGAGNFLIQFATALAGRFRGGPAKVAVVGSAMFSTISGSPSANVVATGSFTIPMMKKLGFTSTYAAAVEAVASNGGNITPPVMGSVAFMIAQFLGISYVAVCLAAALPAVLYFASALFSVDFYAAKNNLRGLPKKDLPSVWSVLKNGWYFAFPLIILVYLLFVPQWSVQLASFWAIAAVYVLEVIRQLRTEHRVDFKRLLFSLEYAGKSYLGIAAALFCIGIILLAIDVTGIALKITSVLIALSGGNLWLLVLFTGIASLILGTGLPAVACYIFVTMLAAPAMLNAGIDPLAAHMFAFHFGNLAHLTPPVALTAFVAAGLANANGLSVAVASTRMATAAWLIPFLFVFRPALLFQGSPTEIVSAAVAGVVGVYALAAVVQGYMFRPLGLAVRLVLAVATVLLLSPSFTTDVIGYGVMGLAVLYELIQARRAAARQTLEIAK